jgi:hypothetical protein
MNFEELDSNGFNDIGEHIHIAIDRTTKACGSHGFVVICSPTSQSSASALKNGFG